MKIFLKLFTTFLWVMAISTVAMTSLYGQENQQDSIKTTAKNMVFCSIKAAKKMNNPKLVKIMKLANIDSLNFSELEEFHYLDTLVLSNIGIRTPPDFRKFKNLKNLVISDNPGVNLSKLFLSLKDISTLKTLRLINDKIEKIPNEIDSLKNLKILDLSQNSFKQFPSALLKLSQLEELSLINCEIISLPYYIDSLASLKKLDIQGNSKIIIGERFGNLSNLKELYLGYNSLTYLPKCFSKLKSLEKLNLNFNNLNDTIFESIKYLTNLTELYIVNNNLSVIPDNFRNLIKMKKLILTGNKITKLPASLGCLKNLTVLKISGISISEINDSIMLLGDSLREIDFANDLLKKEKTTIAEKQYNRIIIYFLEIGLSIILIVFFLFIRLYLKYRRQKKERDNAYDNLMKTKEKLVESEKLAALGSLVSGVAHEINNPLGIGVSDSSFLINKALNLKKAYSEGSMTQDDFENFIEDYITITTRLNKNLIRTGSLVQSFKKLSADQIAENKSIFRIKPYLEEIFISLKPVFKEKDIEISITGDNTIQMNSYTGIFAQILTNFVINSVKYGFQDRSRGLIKLDISQTENNVCIVYSDNGKGIAPQNLSKIFEPFFSTGNGTGLGLSIVYNLVSKLKGTISCNSKEEEGTTFIITLPAE